MKLEGPFQGETQEGFLQGLEACAFAVLLVRRDGVVGYANVQARELFGDGGASLEGLSLVELLPELESDGGYAARRGLEQAASALLERGEVMAQHTDGSRFPVSGQWRALEGSVGGWFMLSLQELAQHKVEVRQLRQQQRLALQTQRLLDLGESVQVTTRRFNRQLRELLEEPEDVRELWERPYTVEAMQEVTQALGKATRMLFHMQDLAQSYPHAPQRQDLAQLLLDMEPCLAGCLPEGFALDMACAPERFFTDTPQVKLRQLAFGVMLSIGEVLREACSPGSINLSVGQLKVDRDYLKNNSLSDLKPGNYVFMAVSGQGRNLERERVRRIFETRGAGHELVHLCYQIEGALVYGALGRRVIAKVLLPTADVEEVEKVDKKSVLVVDDDAQVRAFLMRALTLGGYRPLAAEHGEEALAIFQKERDSIGCVVLDLHMPVMDGVEAFQKLRALDRSVPIIFASSVSDTAFVRRIKQDGSGDFLPKPFTLEAFLASVHKALERPQGDTGFVW